MGNSLRCCLACVIPCGALDLIRIVHLNGHVEEITNPITANEVLKNNPNHVLTKPCSSQGMTRRILIVSPLSELKRGSIYFLIPSSSIPAAAEKKKPSKISVTKKTSQVDRNCSTGSKAVAEDGGACDRRMEKKRPTHRRHRSGSRVVSEWRPHLSSISED